MWPKEQDIQVLMKALYKKRQILSSFGSGYIIAILAESNCVPVWVQQTVARITGEDG